MGTGGGKSEIERGRQAYEEGDGVVGGVLRDVEVGGPQARAEGRHLPGRVAGPHEEPHLWARGRNGIGGARWPTQHCRA